MAYISDPTNLMASLPSTPQNNNIGGAINYFGGDPNAPTQFGKIASIGLLNNFGISGPAGSSVYTPNGVTQSGPGGDLYGRFTGAAGGQLDNLGAFNGDINSTIANLFATGGQSPQSTQANNLFANFGTQLGNFDVNNAAGSYTDILNRLALPQEQQAANSLGNRLFAAGRLGANDTTAGRAFGDLAQAQAAAQDQRSLAAYNLANNQFNTLANATNTFGNLGSTLQTSNLNNFGKMVTIPSALDAQNIQNAGALTSSGNAALLPMSNQLANLFAGAQFSAGQKEAISNALAAKYAANKANGKNAGWAGALSGAMSGAEAGSAAGPWGALAGGILGGAGGYYSNASAGGASGGGSAGGGMMGGMGGLSGLFSMFGGGGSSNTGSGMAGMPGAGGAGGGFGGFGIDDAMSGFGG